MTCDNFVSKTINLEALENYTINITDKKLTVIGFLKEGFVDEETKQIKVVARK